jgi:threonine/homoserine/homoserine lactone efflux protein
MLLRFFIASVLVTLMPGPSMLIVLYHTARGGLGAGARAIAGVVAADAVLLALAASGLGLLLHISPAALTGLKWAGTVYLIWLAWRVWRGTPGRSAVEHAAVAWRQAGTATLLNPGIIVFLLAFLPQFLVPGRAVGGQLRLLAPVFLLAVGLTLLGCAAGLLALRRVPASAANGRRLERGVALALAAYAAALWFAR